MHEHSGASGEPTKEENIFKRIFWPANQPYEVDSLGQQGLWVCLVVATVSAVVSVLEGHPLIALLVFLFYWLGGMGVREHSVTAAVLLTLGYLASIGMVMLLGRPPGIVDIAIGLLLLANVRGTYIASSWKRRSDPEMFPERLNTTFTDKLIDQWPARFWPKGRFVFFAIASVYGALFVLGVVTTLRRPLLVQPDVRTDQLQVAPPSR